MSDPVLNYNAFLYFTCDRAPTATEDDVVESGAYISGYPFHWVDTVHYDIYDFAGGANGSLIWNKRLKQNAVEQSDVIDLPTDLEAMQDEIDTMSSSMSTMSTSVSSMSTALDNKVDKDGSKVLTDVNFTTTLSSKLNGIAAGATVYTNSDADARISAQKGANSGLCPLDSGGKVASAYLPSFVDDVLEYANLAALPGTGETGKIYVALDTGKIYRWSGSAYVEISASPGSTDSVTEGATNKYFTDERAQDAVGNILSAEFSYNDAGNTISLRPRSTNNTPGRTLVSTATSTGYQISSTRDALVMYEGKMNTVTQALVLSAGSSEVEVLLETANTNSTTASDWTVIARQNSSQNIALGVAITSTDGEPWSLSRIIPAGKYVRIRTNVVTGTGSSFSINSEQQETLLN